jgi:hypothetical protein
MRWLVLSLVVALLALGASASWMRPNNLSPECPSPTGGSFLRPSSGDLCNECCERCYALHFDALVVNAAATNTAYCNTNGTLCPVWVFYRVAPCCACTGAEQTESSSVCTGTGARNQTTQTLSACQLKNLTMLVGPQQEAITDLFMGCDADEIVLNKYAHSSDAANEHYTVVGIDACTSSPGGGSLQLVYSSYHDGARFPDVCFADSHFASSVNTSQSGILASSLVIFGPASPSSVWLVANMSHRAPLPISCRVWDSVLDHECNSNAIDSLATIEAHAVDQVGLPEVPKVNSNKVHHNSDVSSASVEPSDVVPLFGLDLVDGAPQA